MKSALEKWLAPDQGEEGDVISEPAQPFDSDTPKTNFALDTSKVKENKADKFDSLFDGDDKKDDKKFDDLPF